MGMGVAWNEPSAESELYSPDSWPPAGYVRAIDIELECERHGTELGLLVAGLYDRERSSCWTGTCPYAVLSGARAGGGVALWHCHVVAFEEGQRRNTRIEIGIEIGIGCRTPRDRRQGAVLSGV